MVNQSSKMTKPSKLGRRNFISIKDQQIILDQYDNLPSQMPNSRKGLKEVNFYPSYLVETKSLQWKILPCSVQYMEKKGKWPMLPFSGCSLQWKAMEKYLALSSKEKHQRSLEKWAKVFHQVHLGSEDYARGIIYLPIVNRMMLRLKSSRVLQTNSWQLMKPWKL